MGKKTPTEPQTCDLRSIAEFQPRELQNWPCLYVPHCPLCASHGCAASTGVHTRTYVHTQTHGRTFVDLCAHDLGVVVLGQQTPADGTQQPEGLFLVTVEQDD